MLPKNTSRVPRKLLDIESHPQEGWEVSTMTPQVGATVHSVEGFAEVVRILGKVTDGTRLLELKTIYEGPGGKSTARMLHSTMVIVTNRTVEIEREGANACLTALTLGCWYFFFQTASIEIYEVS